MSENKIDNNENPVIESEVVVSDMHEDTAAEPVVVRRGSLMNFLAFVFSIAALGLSGYIYYLSHYTSTDNTENDQLLQSSVTALEKKSNQFNQILDSTQKSNQQLSTQLKTLQQQVQAASGSTERPLQEIETFGDSLIKQQITDLTNEIAQQNQLIEQLQNKLNSSNKQNTQSLSKLNTQLQSQISNQSNILPVVSQENQDKTIAGSLLQEAYVQLDINGNVAKSQSLLIKTITQLSQLTGMRYGRLSNELETFSLQLSNIEQPDVESLKSQINQLSQDTNQLEFTHGEISQNTDKESSWFDNLITIKKIDENQQPKLSKSEQITIGNVINNHYQMLQLALMSNNQELWLSELEQTQNLLELHFADNALDINNQLSTMKSIDLNPELPKLEPFLQKFKAINLANENE